MLKPQKKFTRKELKRDPLMDALYRLRHGWLDNRSVVARFGGVALVVVVLSLVVWRWRSTQDEKAAAMVSVAFVEYGRANYNTVIAQISPYVDEYSGLKSFGAGLYLLARSELSVGDSVRAEEYYRQYLDDYGGDPLIASGAWAGLGIIAEGQGSHSEAADHFFRASKRAITASFRRQYAVYAGRNYLLAGDPEATLDVLTPLLDEESMDFQLVDDVRILVASAEIQLSSQAGT